MTTDRARRSLALLSGAVTWMFAAWLASRFVTVPMGAVAFWGVFGATVALFAFLVPLHGFHWEGLRTAIAVGLAGWVALGPMDTPLGSLVAGVAVVGVCFVVAVGVVGMVVSLGRE